MRPIMAEENKPLIPIALVRTLGMVVMVATIGGISLTSCIGAF